MTYCEWHFCLILLPSHMLHMYSGSEQWNRPSLPAQFAVLWCHLGPIFETVYEFNSNLLNIQVVLPIIWWSNQVRILHVHDAFHPQCILYVWYGFALCDQKNERLLIISVQDTDSIFVRTRVWGWDGRLGGDCVCVCVCVGGGGGGGGGGGH